MNSEQQLYEKGELVPGPGTYRCTGSGEIWSTAESNVRFPPCDVCKDGACRWAPYQDQHHHHA